MSFEEYTANEDIKKLRDKMYHGHNRLAL